MSSHAAEVSSGERFRFGSNWARFLEVLDARRIDLARNYLCRMLGVTDLEGKRFLDVGSGSGLFSLVARQLGATVHSFDYDPQSVACTAELRRRYFPDDARWAVEQGSVLDGEYIARLGQWDIVYSWGVLHHTGAMYAALKKARSLVAAQGTLYIAIYNHQRGLSRAWLQVKRLYNKLPASTRWIVLLPALVVMWGPRTLYDLLRGKPFHTWRNYAEHSLRGMSAWRDVVDWVGGYPFEVAKPEEILRFCRPLGLTLRDMTTCGGALGCNEYVFIDAGRP